MSLFVEGKFFKEAGTGGGSGGGKHNLGWYADLTALQTAHPTGEDGDFAILGSTDTVWVWDSGTSAWVDTDQKGQVTSVNNQTGAVTIGADDVLPSQTGNSGKFLTTDGTNASWSDKPLINNTNQIKSLAVLGTTSGGYGVAVGASSAASTANSVAIGYNAKAQTQAGGTAIGANSECGGNGSVAIGAQTKVGPSVNHAIQIGSTGTVTTNSDANTFKVANSNGNFEIMSADGTVPADRLAKAINKYSTMPTAASTNEGWIVQYTGTTDATYTHGYIYECVSDGGNPATYSWTQTNVQPAPSGLPDQTGQSGKFLTTDGTDASWSDKPIINNINNVNGGISILGSSSATGQNSILIGANAGAYSNSDTNCIVVGATSKAATNSIAMGNRANADANACVQINLTSSSIHNTDTGTVKIANSNGNFEIMSADGTIPEARLADTTSAQQGDVLTLDANGDAVWQAGGGGLPTQSGNAGKFLTTDGTDASWADALSNKFDSGLIVTTGTYSITPFLAAPIAYTTSELSSNNISLDYAQLLIGSLEYTGSVVFSGWGATVLGCSCVATGTGAIAIGATTQATANHAIQLGTTGSQTVNSDANTFKVANANGNYEIMSANGTIPAARHADTTSAAQGQVLTLDSNLKPTWAAASGGGVSSISVTLAAASWSGSSQTVTATGVTSSNTVIIGAAPASQAEYNTCGVICTAQGTDSLTFTCTSTPTNDLTVTVLILA